MSADGTEVRLVSAVQRLVVVGGSLTAARIAEEARRIGFAGSITIICAEDHAPYDRPPLSKTFLTSEVEPSLDFHLADPDGLGVTVLRSTIAGGLDTRNRVVRTTHGDVPYDALVIATGAVPRTLESGRGLEGITSLRSVDDAVRIRSALHSGARVAVIGAGFIGGEVASSARARGAEVTMVEAMPLPLVGAVGSLVAERLAVLHRQYGVDLRTDTKVREIAGSRRVEKLVLDDGTTLPVDLVVVGIGVEPATGWLRGSGIAVSDGVACSPYLESTVPGVYAAGDVARWVNPWSGKSTRLEHWTSAGDQAVAVVRNALTEDRRPCSITPYFWSDWYGHKLQLLGEPADEVELLGGGGATEPFVAQYRFDGQLVGAFGLDRTGPVMKLRGSINERASWQDMLRAPVAGGGS
jgi:NADPH-dependent 2,4-dienoyl-CoA reductase/sulfur reductase-like enzyme